MNLFRLLLLLAALLAVPAASWSYGVERQGEAYFWHKYDDKPSVALRPDQGRAAFERVNAPANVILTGLGPSEGQTLTLDRTGMRQVLDLLGKADPLPDDCPGVPLFGYKSARQGDSTVLLVAVDAADTPGSRVYMAELRADARGLKSKSLRSSQAVHAGIATQSGLRLGLTRAQVAAILGWPQHEDKKSMEYGAVQEQAFSLDEIRARGHEKDAGGGPASVYRVIHLAFDKESRVSRLWLYHRVSWDTPLANPAGMGRPASRTPHPSGEDIPFGNWRIVEMEVKNLWRGLLPPVYRLVPMKDGTLERVKAMGRDPKDFSIRGEGPADPDSDGFIVLPLKARTDLRQGRGSLLRTQP
ncbi:hypothetical protein [Desulfovibrio sp.]